MSDRASTSDKNADVPLADGGSTPLLTVRQREAGNVSVEISLKDTDALLSAFREVIAEAGDERLSAERLTVEISRAIEHAAQAFLSEQLNNELNQFIQDYRLMLRECLATQDDLQLAKALSRARLRERILNATPMVDEDQAMELLGFSGADPSATMERKVGVAELLHFEIGGRKAYPLFQFDVDNRRIYPAMTELIAMRPGNWSDYRLLYWLVQSHLDFEDTPAAALGREDDAIISAFKCEIEPVLHG